MVHARVIWPPSYGAKLRNVDAAPAARLPGVLKIVRDGSYLAVIAEREYQAVVAMRALQAAAAWDETPTLPDQSDIYTYLERQPAQQVPIRNDQPVALPPTARIIEARYRRGPPPPGSLRASPAAGRLSEHSPDSLGSNHSVG